MISANGLELSAKNPAIVQVCISHTRRNHQQTNEINSSQSPARLKSVLIRYIFLMFKKWYFSKEIDIKNQIA